MLVAMRRFIPFFRYLLVIRITSLVYSLHVAGNVMLFIPCANMRF